MKSVFILFNILTFSSLSDKPRNVFVLPALNQPYNLVYQIRLSAWKIALKIYKSSHFSAFELNTANVPALGRFG